MQMHITFHYLVKWLVCIFNIIVCAEVLCYSVLENVKHYQSSFLLVNTILRKFVSACLCVILLHIMQTSHNMCKICFLQT